MLHMGRKKHLPIFGTHSFKATVVDMSHQHIGIRKLNKSKKEEVEGPQKMKL